MRWWWWVPVSLGVITALILVAALSVQRSRATLIQLARLIPTCISLLHDIMRDKNVPRRAELAPAIALIYLANPIDLIPDFIPGLGYLDDALIVAWALRHLIAAAGHDRVTAHWHGDPATLERILRLARVPAIAPPPAGS